MIKKQTEKYNNFILNKSSITVFMLILFCSCAIPHHNLKDVQEKAYSNLSGDKLKKINRLKYDLTALGYDADSTEAKQIAETSISYSLVLADKYRLVSPPFLHNILVRLGIKDRGLCYHWAEDLMKRLVSLNLKSFRLHEGVARKGSEFREHNSVVVTARGQNFSEGIVLDPWRNSGDLYWGSVKTDKYPWEER